MLIVGVLGVLITPLNSFCQNILQLEDFGAVYGDAIDDTQAFEDALDSAVILENTQSGVLISLSTGTLILNGTINIPDIFLKIGGTGMDSTILKWESAGGFINVDTATVGPYGNIEISNLAIVAAVSNAGIGLSVEARNSPLITFAMSNVKFDKEGAGYWNTCFSGDLIPLARISDCEFYGDYDNTSYLLRVIGFTVASRYMNCTFSGAQTAMSYEGEMEGVMIMNADISNVDTGIMRRLDDDNASESEPLFQIINSQITAYENCVDVRGIGSSNFTKNTFTIDSLSSETVSQGVYINGTNIERCISITNNVFINKGNANQSNAVYGTDIEKGLIISQNTFENFETGVELINSAQVLIADNTNVNSTLSQLYDLSNLTNLYLESVGINCFSESACQVPVKAVTASSTTSGYDPLNVVDCSGSTEWRSNGIGEYLLFELFDTVVVSSIEISHWAGNARTADFEVLLSTDGVNFFSRGEFTSSGTTQDFEPYLFSPASAKYVKIIANGNSNSNWNQYWGVRIYSNGYDSSCNTPVVGINCFTESACQVPVEAVTASSTTSGYDPLNVIDCSGSTEWRSNGVGEYLIFELSYTELVSSVEISHWGGASRTADFEVLTSTDGTSYTSSGSFTSSGTTQDFESYDITDVSANYVKIIANGNSKNNWNQYWGVRIYSDGEDGSCEKSAVISSDKIDLGFKDQERDFSVYPNPVKGNALTVEYLSDTEDTSVKIINMLGQLMHQSILHGAIGYNNADIDITNLDKGIYILSINGSSVKFIRQ
jgi:hypothetical protein